MAGASLANEKDWTGAIAALADDYQPISDMRASAAYRIEVAQGLLRKALMEVAGEASGALRVVGQREKAA